MSGYKKYSGNGALDIRDGDVVLVGTPAAPGDDHIMRVVVAVRAAASPAEAYAILSEFVADERADAASDANEAARYDSYRD